RLLDQLTALAAPVLNARRMDLTGPAFPGGVASSIEFGLLPLHSRTRNCLERRNIIGGRSPETVPGELACDSFLWCQMPGGLADSSRSSGQDARPCAWARESGSVRVG